MDRNSGQLKVANTIDRESHFVHDGIYTIPVKAVDASKSLANVAQVSLGIGRGQSAGCISDNVTPGMCLVLLHKSTSAEFLQSWIE